MGAGGNSAITDVAPQEWARFWSHVQLTDSGCWLWIGAVIRGGYGSFRFRGRHTTTAHRFAYRALVGVIPEKYQIDHLCRQRNCVNPSHLEAVTQVVNLRRSRQTILTPEDVRYVYELTDIGLGRKHVADRLGITAQHVSDIARGVLWPDLYAEWVGPGKGRLLRKPAA